MDQKIFIASDHAGFDLKTQILNSNKYNMHDLGTNSKESVDYPDFANSLVDKMKSTNHSIGILICGTGVGMAIAANRDKDIRAGVAFNPEIASLIRKHNNANILILPGRFINIQDALNCVDNFLSSKYESGRHQNRLKKIKS